VKLPIKITQVDTLDDGNIVLQVDVEEEFKGILMASWGINEWDDDFASEKFIEAIRNGLIEKEASEEADNATT
jgi:hypothetical protein